MSSEVTDQAESGGLSQAAGAEVLAAVLAGAQSALACWERRADGDLHLVAANDHYLRFMGRPGEKLIGQRLQPADKLRHARTRHAVLPKH